MRPLMRRASWLLPLLVLLPTGQARACSTPVFRYALDRWRAAPYEVVVHSAPLSPEGRARGERLRATKVANLKVAIHRGQGDLPRLGSRPSLAARYPESHEKARPAWGAPLESAT